MALGAFGYRRPQDLPRMIPVFPLGGALLFPRATLPLNIFEPRYLNMIDDAIAGDRLIGMVQPMANAMDAARPALSPIGCVGRITSFAETEDGRYLITLTGVARFKVLRELDMARPYRRVEPDFLGFADDLTPLPSGYQIDRDRLIRSLRRYTETKGFQVDWQAVESAPNEALVNAIATLCPFEPAEKQAVLEAVALDERCAVLITLLELNATPDGQGMRPQ